MTLLTNTPETKLTELKLALGFQDILWISGQVFLFRDFVANAEAQGLDAAFDSCPYGDLDARQRATFTACFHNPRLREVVAQWWAAYDEERAKDNVPSTGHYWAMEPKLNDTRQDVLRLAGLVFLRRGFVAEAAAQGLATTFAYECAYSDLDDAQRATFTACFYNAHLREIVAQWWEVYDEERIVGNIPSAGSYWL